MTLAPGTKISNYEIIGFLGRGGLAEVYRAFYPATGWIAALKLVHPFLAAQPPFKDHFERELPNLTRLRHPNIAQVFDFGYDPQARTYYIVTEFISGASLRELLVDFSSSGQMLPLKHTLKIMREVLTALDYAHTARVVHQDIKPSNIIVLPERLTSMDENCLVMTDFGIARLVSQKQLQNSGGMVGTPEYMSPEQSQGNPGDVRSDLYTMGVIFYQMATGVLPFEAETPMATLLQHINDPLRPPQEVKPDLPYWVSEIITRLLQKNPDHRYQTANELLNRLDEASRSSFPDMKRTTTTARIKPPAQPSQPPRQSLQVVRATPQKNLLFLSHSTLDAAFADLVADKLRSEGLAVWKAPESILPGESWTAAIQRGLSEMTHLLLVISSHAIQSRWVEFEMDTAIEFERAGKVKILPIIYEDCEVPPFWRRYQAIDFRDSSNYDQVFATLIKRLRN